MNLNYEIHWAENGLKLLAIKNIIIVERPEVLGWILMVRFSVVPAISESVYCIKI